MSAESYFAQPDSNDYSRKPHLPETLFPQTIDGMLPNQIVHLEPDSDLIAADGVGKLYLNLSYQFRSKEAANPDYTNGGHVGIMRFCATQEDGSLLDGYLVDLRTLEAGDILVYPSADEDDMLFGDQFPVLGVISLAGDEDNPQIHYASYHRDETLERAVQLAQAVDAVVLRRDAPEPEPRRKKRHTKQAHDEGSRETGADNA